jgi:hypothetical protein
VSDNTERWRVIRHNLACRSDHRCEVCGVRLGPDKNGKVRPELEGTGHHRDDRGMGGTRRPGIDDLCNVLLLCGGRMGGVLGCHGWIEGHFEAAVARGWRVPNGIDPATVPVVLAGGRRVLLHRDQPLYLPPRDGIPYALNDPIRLREGHLIT